MDSTEIKPRGFFKSLGAYCFVGYVGILILGFFAIVGCLMIPMYRTALTFAQSFLLMALMLSAVCAIWMIKIGFVTRLSISDQHLKVTYFTHKKTLNLKRASRYERVVGLFWSALKVYEGGSMVRIWRHNFEMREWQVIISHLKKHKIPEENVTAYTNIELYR